MRILIYMNTHVLTVKIIATLTSVLLADAELNLLEDFAPEAIADMVTAVIDMMEDENDDIEYVVGQVVDGVLEGEIAV